MQKIIAEPQVVCENCHTQWYSVIFKGQKVCKQCYAKRLTMSKDLKILNRLLDSGPSFEADTLDDENRAF